MLNSLYLTLGFNSSSPSSALFSLGAASLAGAAAALAALAASFARSFSRLLSSL